MYIAIMKYEWSSEKNEWLKEERNISFEEVILHLSMGSVWREAEHPDQINYPGQRMYFVVINDYVHLVPFVPGRGSVFLKTIIPSRRATKLFLKEKEGRHEI